MDAATGGHRAALSEGGAESPAAPDGVSRRWSKLARASSSISGSSHVGTNRLGLIHRVATGPASQGDITRLDGLMDGLGQTHRRLNQAIGYRLGNSIGNADHGLNQTSARQVDSLGLVQFGLKGEDVLRVAESEPHGVRQLEDAAEIREWWRSKVALQEPNFAADRLRRQVQLLARAALLLHWRPVRSSGSA